MGRENLRGATAPAAEHARCMPDLQIGFLLRAALQRHTAIFSARMIEGLTPTQFGALAKLYEVGPCSQNHLGRLIHLDAATIKGVVDRLSARDLVVALSDPNDRRRRAVTLTQRGRRLTEAAMQVSAEIASATLAPLSEDERQLATKLLRKLV
jgi:MarR family transcriptional regulator, lower aerobic nicotinate degradation pathway regulator